MSETPESHIDIPPGARSIQISVGGTVRVIEIPPGTDKIVVQCVQVNPLASSLVSVVGFEY